MAAERPYASVPRMPKSVDEQELLDARGGDKISQELFKGLSFLLRSYGVEIDWEKSGPRPVKTIGRIEDKIIRRNSTHPMRDIYGVRFITEDARRGWLTGLIQSAYPDTPKVFFDGKPSARDYRNPAVRAGHIEKDNPHMSPMYSALHINIVFRRENSGLFDIGEVQIMTQEELKIYNETRDGYSKDHS